MSSLAHIYRPRHTGPTFTSSEVLLLTGVTYRQLDHWTRTGRIVGPSVEVGRGSGHSRVFSEEDVVEVAVLARLLIAGLSLGAAHQHLDAVLDAGGQPMRLAMCVELAVDVDQMHRAIRIDAEQMRTT